MGPATKAHTLRSAQWKGIKGTFFAVSLPSVFNCILVADAGRRFMVCEVVVRRGSLCTIARCASAAVSAVQPKARDALEGGGGAPPPPPPRRPAYAQPLSP